MPLSVFLRDDLPGMVIKKRELMEMGDKRVRSDYIYQNIFSDSLF